MDAEVAYSFVRHWKPRKVIEIGGGFSQRILSAALQVNHKYAVGELITIDPSPQRVPCRSDIEVVTCRVQDVPFDTFLSLREGDILFLDSSHVVGVGSDVVREYLEIIPSPAQRCVNPYSRHLSSFRLSPRCGFEQTLLLVGA